MSKIVFLDRDGVINQDSWNYIKSPEEFIPIPGSIAAIARLTTANYRVGVATNQSGISRGLYDIKTLSAIHRKMLDLVEEAGGHIEAIEYCMHLPEEHCDCRKPKPGLLIALSKRMDCALKGVPFIGDRISDIQAAEAVGALPMLIKSPMTDRSQIIHYPHVPQFESLAECVEFVLKNHD